jgi:acetyl esterase/lipase
VLEFRIVHQDPDVLAEARDVNEDWTLEEPAPLEIDRLRADYRLTNPAASPPRWEHATDEAIAGVRCRVVRPSDPTGVYLHVHGGGFCLGSAGMQDRQLAGISRATGASVVSIDYRLAPEHPYPAALDDCHAVARAVIDEGPGTLVIGGESAGANLSVATLLRLRDDGLVDRVAAANLLYGGYTMGPLPSRDRWGDRYLVLSKPLIEAFHAWYGGRSDDPFASPLVADLSDLPPALFTVGTEDPLLDDSLLLASKWVTAGSSAALDVWPGAAHAFDAFPTAQGRLVRRRLADWLRRHFR